MEELHLSTYLAYADFSSWESSSVQFCKEARELYFNSLEGLLYGELRIWVWEESKEEKSEVREEGKDKKKDHVDA